MAKLHIKPQGTSGKVHDITPQSADWGYVGFALHRLEPGDSVSGFWRVGRTDERL